MRISDWSSTCALPISLPKPDVNNAPPLPDAVEPIAVTPLSNAWLPPSTDTQPPPTLPAEQPVREMSPVNSATLPPTSDKNPPLVDDTAFNDDTAEIGRAHV